MQDQSIPRRLLLRRARLLLQHAPLQQASPQESEAAEESACLLAGLPLALDQAGSGLVLAHYAVDKTDITQIRQNLYRYWNCAQETRDDFDTFYTGFNESWYFVARASSIIQLLRLDPTLIKEVWEALALAQESTEPKYVRRRSSIELYYAQAAFHVGDYTPAVSTAIGALELARSVGDVQNVGRIQRLYEKLTQTKIKDSAELRELRDALKR